MARKTVMVSDMSGEEILEGHGAKVTIRFGDARMGAKELDLTDDEAKALGGRQVKRRGRKPGAAAQKSEGESQNEENKEPVAA